MKNFILQFGSGSPATYTGLSPTFSVFNAIPGGGATTPPGITELPTATGLYYFTCDPASSIAFVVDGGASIIGSARYIAGSLDPIQKVDETVNALGVSMLALGVTLVGLGLSNSVGVSSLAILGNLGDSYGTTLTDPTTVMGYLRRFLEFNEGDSSFNKQSGLWDIFTRGTTHILGATTYPGLTTLLREKLITDDGSIVTKE